MTMMDDRTELRSTVAANSQRIEALERENKVLSERLAWAEAMIDATGDVVTARLDRIERLASQLAGIADRL